MEKVQWKVEGMDCSNCALTIHKYLEKEGMKNVKVNFANGDVLFDTNEAHTKEEIAKGIHDLGYEVVSMKTAAKEKKVFLRTHLQRFLFCLPFTLLLMLHMIPGIHIVWLMNPWINLALCIPVYFIGMKYFGKSAWKSIRNGIPNMNVLITLGATAAFVYSLAASLMGLGEVYLFYETAATIITLIFLGNYLEHASIQSTQRALNKLVRSQKVMANVIAFDDEHTEHIFPIENTQLKAGDLLLIKTGEQVPADCKILWGNATVNESIITGESLPIVKQAKDQLIGGSILNDGTVKAQVTAAVDASILSGIINLVKQAQGEKPPVQQLADKISAIFVPVVLIIAAITLAANWIILGNFTPSIMRAIAVLVIACPCAMGLATPAAIAVGLGRGTRNGILFRNATSLELFKDIRQAVFDKTGTLTTGKFQIAGFHFENINEEEFKKIVFSLEKYASHPIAKSIVKEWKTKDEIRWKKVDEIKGVGIKAENKEGNIYTAGSYKMAGSLVSDDSHNVYITKNETLLGWIDVKDELRPESKTVINYLHSKGIKTILLTGDRYQKSKKLAEELGIDEVKAEQTPQQKMETIAELTASIPTIMVGDGINDAPALAKATIGISISDASQLAMQTAQVVLMSHGLTKLPTALGLGKQTFNTIKQNLFWAFFYNIIAIPIAAFGLLTPSFAALAMGFSDVVLAINSVRLFTKKVE
ncbi:MAG TPA: cation-translocating P-type ATPase [Chitinophagaceae bacterium]|nr:cation-translocating P-type ATPase [Chitinophagaceae bacterium]